MRLLICLFCLAVAMAATPAAPMPATLPPRPSGPLPYLALGDSYTIGEGLADPAGRWPNQLAALARAQGLPVGPPDIIARTGWTTTELLAAIRASHNTRTDYGLVSLLIGVNDQYRGYSVAEYARHFRELLARAAIFAGGQPGRVLVLSIPDWGQAPFAAGQDQALIGRQIDQFNAVARAECQRVGSPFIDITPLSRGAGAGPPQFVADGLHYTGASMAAWAERALAAVGQLGSAAGNNSAKSTADGQ